MKLNHTLLRTSVVTVALLGTSLGVGFGVSALVSQSDEPKKTSPVIVTIPNEQTQPEAVAENNQSSIETYSPTEPIAEVTAETPQNTSAPTSSTETPEPIAQPDQPAPVLNIEVATPVPASTPSEPVMQHKADIEISTFEY